MHTKHTNGQPDVIKNSSTKNMESIDILPPSKGVVESGLVQQWIQDILDPNSRDHALAELSRCREAVPDLAVQLWEAFGTPCGVWAC